MNYKIVLIREKNSLNKIHDTLNYIITFVIVLTLFFWLIGYELNTTLKEYFIYTALIIYFIKEQFLTMFLSKRIGYLSFQKEKTEVNIGKNLIVIKNIDLIKLDFEINEYRHWKGNGIPRRIKGTNNVVEIYTKQANYMYNFICKTYEDKAKVKKIAYTLHHKGYKISYVDNS